MSQLLWCISFFMAVHNCTTGAVRTTQYWRHSVTGRAAVLCRKWNTFKNKNHITISRPLINIVLGVVSYLCNVFTLDFYRFSLVWTLTGLNSLSSLNTKKTVMAQWIACKLVILRKTYHHSITYIYEQWFIQSIHLFLP